MSRLRTSCLAVAGGVLVLGLGGCSGQSASNSEGISSAASADYLRAEVGQCHDFTHKQSQLVAELSAAVPCTDDHTGQTFYVAQLPDSEQGVIEPYWDRDAGGSASIPEGTYVTDQIEQCDTKLDEMLGRQAGRIPDRFSLKWFGPSKQSWAQGDRALRCDVVWETWRLDDADEQVRRLRDLPAASMVGFVSSRRAPQWAVCQRWTEAKGSTSSGECKGHQNPLVTFGRQERWPKDKAWPGRVAVQKSTIQWCSKVARRFATDEHDYRGVSTMPIKATWKKGERTVECLIQYKYWNRQGTESRSV